MMDSLKLLKNCRDALLKDRDFSTAGLIFDKETVTEEDEPDYLDKDQQLVVRSV